MNSRPVARQKDGPQTHKCTPVGCAKLLRATPFAPSRTRHTIRKQTNQRKEQRATVIHSRRSDVGFYPWLTIGSARWLRIGSARTHRLYQKTGAVVAADGFVVLTILVWQIAGIGLASG